MRVSVFPAQELGLRTKGEESGSAESLAPVILQHFEGRWNYQADCDVCLLSVTMNVISGEQIFS